MVVKRYEITEIIPDRHIADAMDKQAAAERTRREQIKVGSRVDNWCTCR
jgi:regulator of protease activity HflC (stomatin/prohibitin superfamily)